MLIFNLIGFFSQAAGGGGAGGPAPIPVTTDLRVHFDASQLSLNNGDPVATWPDLSGNGLDMFQTDTSIQPFFDADGLEFGRGAIRFDANGSNVGNHLDLDGVNPNGNTFTAAELFYVCRVFQDPSALAQTASHMDWNGFSQSYHPFNDGRLFTTFASRSRIQGGDSTNFGNTLTSNHIVNEFGTDGERFFKIYQDGFLKVDFSTTANTFQLQDSDGSHVITIGKGATISGWNWDAWLGELIIYTRKLTTAERQQVIDYLGNKWGISVPTL